VGEDRWPIVVEMFVVGDRIGAAGQDLGQALLPFTGRLVPQVVRLELY
jgi:hypothetical protein